MLALMEQKRQEYQRYAPAFWRVAQGAVEAQRAYFTEVLEQAEFILMVDEEEMGNLAGFAIGRLMDAPPVYSPGSRVCQVDDFTVARPEQWATVGRDLLGAVRTAAESQGARLLIVVCGQRDEPKRAMLRAAGYAVASEWYVNPL